MRVLVQHSESKDKFSRLTALNWLHTFVTHGREHLMPFCAQAPPQTNRPLTQLNSTGTWFAPVSFFIARSASRPYLLGSLQR